MISLWLIHPQLRKTQAKRASNDLFTGEQNGKGVA
jgi:hypothetical protein